jgi:hypothetical protein
MITLYARKALRSILFAAVGLMAGSALAGSLTFNGNLQPPTPTMPVVFIAGSLCTGQGVAPVTYRRYPIHVTEAGVYTMDLNYAAGGPSFYLFEGSFNPAAAFPTCVQADNSAPEQIVFNLNPGTDYFVVVFDDTFAQDSGAFSVTINGPGNILAGLTPIPTLSEWGVILLSTLLALGAIVSIRRRRQA